MRHLNVLFLILVLLISSPITAETLRISSIDWQPYSGRELTNGGIFNQLITEAFLRAGYDVEYEYVPWGRALARAYNGQVDVVAPIYLSATRQEKLGFSDAVYRVDSKLITLADSTMTFDGTMASLRPYTIGLLRYSALVPPLKMAGIQVVEYTEQHQHIGLLLKRRVDALLLASEVFFYQQQQHQPDLDKSTLRVLTPAYSSLDLHIAVSKKRADYHAIIEAFNHGLAAMKADGTYEALLQQAGIPSVPLAKPPLLPVGTAHP